MLRSVKNVIVLIIDKPKMVDKSKPKAAVYQNQIGDLLNIDFDSETWLRATVWLND